MLQNIFFTHTNTLSKLNKENPQYFFAGTRVSPCQYSSTYSEVLHRRFVAATDILQAPALNKRKVNFSTTFVL
jgi:hypothetical protein